MSKMTDQQHTDAVDRALWALYEAVKSAERAGLTLQVELSDEGWPVEAKITRERRLRPSDEISRVETLSKIAAGRPD